MIYSFCELPRAFPKKRSWFSARNVIISFFITAVAMAYAMLLFISVLFYYLSIQCCCHSAYAGSLFLPFSNSFFLSYE